MDGCSGLTGVAREKQPHEFGPVLCPRRNVGAFSRNAGRLSVASAAHFTKSTDVLQETLQIQVAAHRRTVAHDRDMLSGPCHGHVHSPVIPQKAYHPNVV